MTRLLAGVELFRRETSTGGLSRLGTTNVDVVAFEEFLALRRYRIEKTSGRVERVFHLELPNGRQVLVRDRQRTGVTSEATAPALRGSVAGETFWIVAEVPADNSRAVVLREDDVAGELRRIAARPARERVELPFVKEAHV